MNFVIEAVDAGHVNHAEKCTECKVAWPCQTILDAREANRGEAARVAALPPGHKSNGLGPWVEQIR